MGHYAPWGTASSSRRRHLDDDAVLMIPLGDNSNAPSYLLERNINGFYLKGDKFSYDPDAQAKMMSWINEQVLPAYLLHPEITVKPFDIKLEELALDMMGELDLDFDYI